MIDIQYYPFADILFYPKYSKVEIVDENGTLLYGHGLRQRTCKTHKYVITTQLVNPVTDTYYKLVYESKPCEHPEVVMDIIMEGFHKKVKETKHKYNI